MNGFISEQDVGQIDFAGLDAVLIARPGDIAGVAVWEGRRLPPMCHPNAEAPIRSSGRVVIAVDDPDDAATIARVREAIGRSREQWLRRRP